MCNFLNHMYGSAYAYIYMMVIGKIKIEIRKLNWED